MTDATNVSAVRREGDGALKAGRGSAEALDWALGDVHHA